MTLVGAVPPRAFFTWAARSSRRAASGYVPVALTARVGSPPPTSTTSPARRASTRTPAPRANQRRSPRRRGFSPVATGAGPGGFTAPGDGDPSGRATGGGPTGGGANGGRGPARGANGAGPGAGTTA